MAYAYLISSGIISSGIQLFNNVMHIYCGGSATTTTVNRYGSMTISSGGNVTSTMVNSDGRMRVYGNATSTTVNSRGSMTVFSGGNATSTTVNSDGKMELDGGSATVTTVNSGGIMLIYNGSATATTVNSGGSMMIYGGGSVTATTVKVDGRINGFTFSEDQYYDSGLHISNAYISRWDHAYLYAGQTATSTTVNSDSYITVSSGGSAISTTVNSGGNMTIYAGGSATLTTVNSGGAINGFTFSEDRYFDSGFHISNAYVSRSADLYAGQTAISTMVNSDGYMYISSGGSATSTTVNSRGSMTVDSGGSATATTVNAGGYMTVYEYGSATATTVNSGGYMAISGGSATSTTVNGGYMTVSFDGSAVSTTVNSGGYMMIYGSAVSTTVNFCGDIYIGGNVTSTTVNAGGSIDIDGRATSTVVNSGGNMELDGGSATVTTVNSGGIMLIYNGSATATTVNSGGRMYVSSGYVNGLQIAQGGQVILNRASRLDFRIIDQLSTADVLVNDWSLIVDNGAFYTITVGQNQWNGVYQLAGGATNFNKDITITVDGIGTIGTFTDSSNVITSGDYTYTLGKTENGTLTLTVQGGLEPPEVPLGNPVIAGGNAIQIMADGTVKIHSAGSVTSPGRIDPNAWTLLDSGDFNRDGKDGLLWLEKATGNVYMQDDLSSMAEVTNKSNCLGTAGGGYEVQAAGDFFGTGFDGALLLGPAFGDSTVSLNYSLDVWAREQDGKMQPGHLGALVNTWEESGPLNSLKGDFQNLTGEERNKVINANNYRYELVGVGDFNGDGIDDVMLRNTMPGTVNGETITGAGDVFVFLTDTRENVIAGNRPAEGIVYTGCATDGWDVVGIGDFNGDGIDDVVISNGTDLAGWQVSNGQRTEDLWFGSLTDGWKFAGVGDFDADGTDDILLADPDNNLAAWKVKDGQAAGIITLA